MSKPDGGPAFPQQNEQRYEDPAHGLIRPSDIYGPANAGMSLRDYFAGQALVGALANPNLTVALIVDIAERCYQLADVMLGARSAE